MLEGSDGEGHEAVSEAIGPLLGYAAYDPILSWGGDVDEKSVSFISPEQRLRKYLEEHPRKSEYMGKAIQSHRLVDKNGEEFEMWHGFWARDAPRGNRNVWGRRCRLQR